MKKSELVKIIKTAVREELKTTLPSLLGELKIPTHKTKNVENQPTDIVEQAKKKIRDSRENEPSRKYSKNPVINKILNETKGGIPQDGSRVHGDGDLINEFTDTNGQSVDVNNLPDHLSNALTRDYTDVMKLVDKKRGIVG